MQVPVHASSFVIGQPINPVSWPRKLPKPTYISVNTARRPASADSTCTVSSTDSSPVSPLPSSPSTSNLHSSQSRSETEVQRAVSRLLSLTKQLQEVLVRWANGAAYEEDVSDAFVLVGSQFDATVHAFYHVGVDMRDLYDVPVTLRTVLEGLLAEYPSPETLERHMPEIRTALVKLLRGLQAKQAPYWASVSPYAPSTCF
ncbi:hypothetical protein DICSQDRAFT_178784 [Dichomitus squalens LYAD-421 SS1]|uniref:Aip3p/Bud6 N-terminal domain-containing protein n=1 Tax=Dichomitus squalens TaxID=114155 RepID=A0A4Q9M6V8_9APHY|nr:uncharacterized protein DICSQDRAFT_178784 [Dichomitus squalens LYAD-421 SS1]EJF64318.1 hypothetical protein DICSQDRAFT_178784 [Dichomitus squalens LYAD-421 SS1]TBU22695.1 hypothetical protein BD311DRAFT_705097 [Dichomitus squalens]